MRILGIGVDIIQNKRIKSLIKNELFVSRTFGTKEIYFSKNISHKANYFAKSIATKEDLAKSIGTDFRNNLNFKDIQILNDKIGKPYYQKSKKIDKIINKKFKVKTYDLFLSMSDEKNYSIAFTILQTQYCLIRIFL